MTLPTARAVALGRVIIRHNFRESLPFIKGTKVAIREDVIECRDYSSWKFRLSFDGRWSSQTGLDSRSVRLFQFLQQIIRNVAEVVFGLSRHRSWLPALTASIFHAIFRSHGGIIGRLSSS